MKKRVNVVKKISTLLSALAVGLTAAAMMAAVTPSTTSAQTSTNSFESTDSSTACPEGKYVKDDGSPCATSRSIPVPESKNSSIIEQVNFLITLMTAIVGVIIAISLVAAAITYSSAGGDPSRVAAAKKRITNSIVALIAYIFAFGVIEWLVPGGLIP